MHFRSITVQEMFVIVLYLNDLRSDAQAEQDWIRAVNDKVIYPSNMRDFKGAAECDCGTDACAGGRLQLHVRVPGDRQVFRERHEKSQGVASPRKGRPNPLRNGMTLCYTTSSIT